MSTKKGLLILSSCVLILVLTVSFSFRSDAAGYASRLTLPEYTITGSFNVRLYGDELVFSDGKGSTTVHQDYSSSAFSFPVSVMVPLRIINNNTVIYATGGLCSYQFTPVFTLDGSYTSGTGVSYSAGIRSPRIYFQDQSAYVGSGSYSRLVCDVSSFYNQNIAVDTSFFIAFDFVFTGSALTDTVVTFNYTIKLTDQDLLFYPTDAVDSTVLKEVTEQQTQTVTKGYDNTGMESTNSSLSSSLTDYDEKEGQLTDQSVGYIDGASFISPSSNASVLASISFCTSWLQSLFVNLGDWSLLVVISLSLSFGLMLIGWLKYR